jgi:hypothetical protein
MNDDGEGDDDSDANRLEERGRSTWLPSVDKFTYEAYVKFTWTFEALQLSFFLRFEFELILVVVAKYI